MKSRGADGTEPQGSDAMADGSQRGGEGMNEELASTQYYKHEQERLDLLCKEFNENVIKPVVDKLIEDGVLPKADYTISQYEPDNEVKV